MIHILNASVRAYDFFPLHSPHIWFHDIDITVFCSIQFLFGNFRLRIIQFACALSIMKIEVRYNNMRWNKKARERERGCSFLCHVNSSGLSAGGGICCWYDDGASPFPLKCAMKWSAIGSWIHFSMVRINVRPNWFEFWCPRTVVCLWFCGLYGLYGWFQIKKHTFVMHIT